MNSLIIFVTISVSVWILSVVSNQPRSMYRRCTNDVMYRPDTYLGQLNGISIYECVYRTDASKHPRFYEREEIPFRAQSPNVDFRVCQYEWRGGWWCDGCVKTYYNDYIHEMDFKKEGFTFLAKPN